MNIFVGGKPPTVNVGGVWFKDGIEPFVWDTDMKRWVSVGNCNMKTQYKFGFMLERIDDWEIPTPDGNPGPPMWRVFSARLHGPVMFTRRSAFFAWLKNWLNDCVRTKRRRIAG